MAQVHNISAIDSLGVVRCYAHGLEASLMTSKSANNPGRQYYCCSKNPSDPDRCSFWYWKDDPMFQQRYSIAAASTAFLKSPVSSQTEPPTTPLQKKRLPSSHRFPSQKRLKFIQEALETPSAHAHAQSDEEGTSESALSTPCKSKSSVDISLALGATRKASTLRITGHILDHPPSPTPHRIKSPQPSVPHGREVGKVSANISTENTDDEDAELWDCVTPPGIQDVSLGTHVGTVSTEKRSQETIAGPSHSNLCDQSNSSDQSSQPHNSISKPKPSPYIPTSFDSASSDQPAETSTIVSFDEKSEQVARLKRRLLASEKSNMAKAKRICELREIIERLQEENRALGGSVGSSLPPRY